MTYTPPAPGSDQEFTEDLAYLHGLADAMTQLHGPRLTNPNNHATVYAQLCAELTPHALWAIFGTWDAA